MSGWRGSAVRREQVMDRCQCHPIVHYGGLPTRRLVATMLGIRSTSRELLVLHRGIIADDLERAFGAPSEWVPPLRRGEYTLTWCLCLRCGCLDYCGRLFETVWPPGVTRMDAYEAAYRSRLAHDGLRDGEVLRRTAPITAAELRARLHERRT